MGVLSTCTFAHQKRASDPMGLQLEMVMSHHEDAGNWLCLDGLFVCPSPTQPLDLPRSLLCCFIIVTEEFYTLLSRFGPKGTSIHTLPKRTSIHTLSSRFRDHWGPARGSRWQQWSSVSHRRGTTHMNTEGLWLHAEDLWKIKPDKIPAWKKGGHKASTQQNSWQQKAARGGESVPLLCGPGEGAHAPVHSPTFKHTFLALSGLTRKKKNKKTGYMEVDKKNGRNGRGDRR